MWRRTIWSIGTNVLPPSWHTSSTGRSRQQFPLKGWHVSTKLHWVILQKVAIFNPNLKCNIHYSVATGGSLPGYAVKLTALLHLVWMLRECVELYLYSSTSVILNFFSVPSPLEVYLSVCLTQLFADAVTYEKKLLYFHIFDLYIRKYECWNFNSGNYLFTTDTK